MTEMKGIGRGNNPASRANLKSRTAGAPGLKGAGRPRGTTRRIQDIAADYGCEAPSAEQVMECYRTMLGLHESCLKDVCANKTRPMLERIIAKEILSKRGFDVIERIIDRVCGRPKQSTDITSNGKDIKDERIEVEIIDSRSQVVTPDN